MPLSHEVRSHAQGEVRVHGRYRGVVGSCHLQKASMRSVSAVRKNLLNPHNDNICSYEPYLAWSICEEEEGLSRDGLPCLLPYFVSFGDYLRSIKFASQTLFRSAILVPNSLDRIGCSSSHRARGHYVDEHLGYLGIENCPLAPWRRRRRSMGRHAGNDREGKKSAP